MCVEAFPSEEEEKGVKGDTHTHKMAAEKRMSVGVPRRRVGGREANIETSTLRIVGHP